MIISNGVPIFTSEQLARYEEDFLYSGKIGQFKIREKFLHDLLETRPEAKKFFSHVNLSHFKKCDFSGRWLSEYLIAKFPKRDRSEIDAAIFAFGQKAFHTKEENIDNLVLKSIEDFRNFEYIPSPEDLGSQLFDEFVEV